MKFRATEAIDSIVGEFCSIEAAGVAAMHILALDDEPPVLFIVRRILSPGRVFLQGPVQSRGHQWGTAVTR